MSPASSPIALHNKQRANCSCFGPIFFKFAGIRSSIGHTHTHTPLVVATNKVQLICVRLAAMRPKCNGEAGVKGKHCNTIKSSPRHTALVWTTISFLGMRPENSPFYSHFAFYAGVDTNVRDSDGNTPLHHAVVHQNANAMQLILQVSLLLSLDCT